MFGQLLSEAGVERCGWWVNGANCTTGSWADGRVEAVLLRFGFGPNRSGRMGDGYSFKDWTGSELLGYRIFSRNDRASFI